jgi:T5SS/PEP-CTERM-associated repeat protein/autotransporter-associated beta strand protein
LIANAGSNGGTGGGINFFDQSMGGTARVEVFGNGTLDISGHESGSVGIGSLEGSGMVLIGANTLTTGASNMDTVFSGTIGDSGAGGSLTKIGSGTMTMTGASRFAAGTAVNGGTLALTGGGSISDFSAAVGFNSQTAGAGTVGGAGSQWLNSGQLTVGSSGNGTLTITAGGTVTSTPGVIAGVSESMGTATVDGAGSMWTNSGVFYVGAAGMAL